jgi:hypothetical protein
MGGLGIREKTRLFVDRCCGYSNHHRRVASQYCCESSIGVIVTVSFEPAIQLISAISCTERMPRTRERAILYLRPIPSSHLSRC